MWSKVDDIVTIRRVLTRFTTRCAMPHGETLYYCIACRKSGPEFQTGSGAGGGTYVNFVRFIFKNTTSPYESSASAWQHSNNTHHLPSIIYHLINRKELFLRFFKILRVLKEKKRKSFRFFLIFSTFSFPWTWTRKRESIISHCSLEFRFSELSQRWQRGVFSFRQSLGLMHSWRARVHAHARIQQPL